MNLFDKINHLRSTASFLFDLGKKQRLSSEEISLTIQPLSNKLKNEIINSSIKERAMAIKSLEHQIEAHNLDKEIIENKIEDCMQHIETLKNSLINALAEKEKHVHTEEGYTVTIIEGEVIIR